MVNFLSNAFNFAYIFKTITTRWYYYIALIVLVFLLFALFFIKKGSPRNSLTKTQKICYTAILVSLSVIANIFDIKISDALQISFVASIGFIAGYLLGGGYGFAVCFMGDLLGAIINPHGPYNPIIGIGTGLWGLIPGIAFSYFKGNKFIKTGICFFLGFVLVSAGINTLGFCLMYPTHYTFEILLPLLPFKFITCVVNCAMCYGIIVLLPKILPNSKFNF